MLLPLLRVALAEDPGPHREELARAISRTSESAWRSQLAELHAHRLHAFAAWILRRNGLMEEIPAFARAELEAAHTRCFLENGRALHLLDRVLESLREREIEPVLLKGAALLATVYPSPGCRPMLDVDLQVDARRLQEALLQLRSLGFEESSRQDDTVNLRRGDELTLDLHHRLRIFERWEMSSLAVQRAPRFQRASAVRLLAPAPMLVHLVAHLEGHRAETGHVLGWLLDVGLVCRAAEGELEPSELRRLAPSAEDHLALLRVMGFLERELELPLPPELAAEARALRPRLELEAILRSRRRALWGLPGVRAWAKLAAHCVGLRRRPGSPLPTWRDLFG